MMKRPILLLITVLLFSGCSKNPTKLACEVWEERRIKTIEVVDFWSDLSKKRELTIEEKSQAWKDQDDFLSVLREMDSVGCKY